MTGVSPGDGSETRRSEEGPETACPPTNGDDWLSVTTAELPVEVAHNWAALPSCGAVVVFSGPVRDHAEGRTGVTRLEYEAYEEQVLPKLAAIASEIRRRWPSIVRLALVHRLGVVPLGQSSVLVVTGAPHRVEAFEAARYGIDMLKATVPIWKREVWDGGASWGVDAQHITELPRPGSVSTEARS
jgi:molybdopterin synthase catalytic subunit